MLVTNQTTQDSWFGPLHLLGGVGQTLTVDETSDTSLYLSDDAVADAINNLYGSGKITVSSAASPFPRPTGMPSVMYGDGSPEGPVYAPPDSLYLRRDGGDLWHLYVKSTAMHLRIRNPESNTLPLYRRGLVRIQAGPLTCMVVEPPAKRSKAGSLPGFRP
ncbi:MAG TPA: hypothetical protein VGL78_06140 [Solirubrobacteraceae bacterium]